MPPTQPEREEDNATHAFGWWPEIAGVVLAAAILALLFVFAANI